MADLIKIPEINKLVLNDFRPHSYGGNQWFYRKEDSDLWFISIPEGDNLKPCIQIKEAAGKGYRSFAIVYFKRLIEDMQAESVRYGMNDPTPIAGNEVFTVGKNVFSGKWVQPLGFCKELSMAWNNERPPRELAGYAAKEATYHLLERLDITNSENVQAFEELD